MKQLDPISHVMTASLKTVQIHQKLSEVRRIFIENQLHHVPVVHDRKLVGLISTTDMMQRNLVTIDINSTVRKAAHLLSDGVFHSLPVVDKDNNLVGIITSTDLIRYLTRLC